MMRDIDVRTAIKRQLAAQHAGDGNTLIVEEMGIWSGSVRIDVAVINGELSGFELKSDRDTLGRLPAQADIYSRVFDRVALVVGSKHAAKAIDLIPSWWEVIVATDARSGVILESARAGTVNPSPDPYLVAELLGRNEAVAVLESFGLAKGWRSKRIKLIHQRLAAELSFQDLSFCVRETLKRRSDWLGQNRSDQLNVPVDT